MRIRAGKGLTVFAVFLMLATVFTSHASEPQAVVLVQKNKRGELLREFLSEMIGEKVIRFLPRIAGPAILDRSKGEFSFSFLSQRYHCSSSAEEIFEGLRCGNNFFQVKNFSDTFPVVPGCENLMLPFAYRGNNRLEAFRKRLKSHFGDGRKSYGRSHVHAGVDVALAFGEAIFSIAPGLVVFASRIPVDGTIVMEHRIKGKSVFSKYVHVADVRVHAGQVVQGGDLIAHGMSAAEFRRSKLSYNHVHLEIRKDFRDFGMASSKAKSVAELKINHYDPSEFFKDNL